MLEKYNTLHQTNLELQQTMDQLQRQLDALNATKSNLEDQICVSPVSKHKYYNFFFNYFILFKHRVLKIRTYFELLIILNFMQC